MQFFHIITFNVFSIGANIKQLIERPDGVYCFREQKDRVYYVAEKLLKMAETLPADEIVSVGTCFGKFTKNNKFRLHVTCLNYLAPYAQVCIQTDLFKKNLLNLFKSSNGIYLLQCKIWVKPSMEQQYLYGRNVTKTGMGRISENAEKYQGVIIMNMADLPLGFGVTARSAAECKQADPLAIVCFNQGDVGEYVRSENALL